ncbi:MAG TPA: tetratricopeptide repeat protein [Rubricoccaceae bacterium]|nr:tetratricopeptide repeat protein [Rubricoccaceae bacterium]
MVHLTPSRLAVALVCATFLLAGADGCSSDPDVEGAKLYINNEEYDQALANLERAIANNPDNAEAHALKAEVLRLKAEDLPQPAPRRPLYEEMVTALDRAVTLDPSLGELRGDAMITRMNAWAKEMNQGGSLLRNSGSDTNAAAGAVAAFNNAVIIQPDSSSSHFNLGLAYLVQGDTEAAVAPLRRAVSMGDASAEAYRYLGVALLRTGEGAEAVTVLEEGAQRYPDDDALRAELLNAYAATNQPERAVTAYEEMIANDPENALLRYNYGSTLLQLGRYDEAIEQLTEAIRLDPSNANAHYNLGAAYQNQGFALNQRLAEEDLSDAEAERIRDERDALFREALPHLQEARRLTEEAGEDAADICNALFQVYTPLGMIEEAEEAAACAGMDMN